MEPNEIFIRGIENQFGACFGSLRLIYVILPSKKSVFLPSIWP